MVNNFDDAVISTLEMEYNAIRQEIRDLINSMDTNFNTSIAMIAGLVALAGFTKDIRLLYLIPSLLFLSVSIHLMKAASANAHGVYCQLIEKRLKALLGEDKVLLNWESKWLQFIGAPSSIVQIGFYFVFAPVVGFFLTLAILAYYWHHWTIIIHGIELLSVAFYAVRCMKWNTSAHREKIIREYGG
jgi:hypothetical protein